jgi:hypothetical protein
MGKLAKGASPFGGPVPELLLSIRVLFSGYQAQQNLDAPPCRVAVHRGGTFPLPGQHLPRGGDNLSRIRAHKRMGSFGNRRWPLSLFAQGQTRSASIITLPTRKMLSRSRPSFHEIGHRVFLRNKKVVGNRIGQKAVYFFRHGALKTAQSRLHVGGRKCPKDFRHRAARWAPK